VVCELARLDARERNFISAMVCACWMWMRPLRATEVVDSLPHPCSSCMGVRHSCVLRESPACGLAARVSVCSLGVQAFACASPSPF
jgi:hypothetical protein